MTLIKKGEKKAVKKGAKNDVVRVVPSKREERKEKFLTAFESSACNVSVACRSVGISRNTFYQWRKKDLVFAEAVKDHEEGLLDFAETMLYKAIKEGKTPELIFFLKTKGQARGYVEKQKVEYNQERPDLTGMSLEELRQIAYGSN